MKTLIRNLILCSITLYTAPSLAFTPPKIALLDTGCNISNVDGVSFTDTSPFTDTAGHGTLMTKVILDTFPQAHIVMVKISNTRSEYYSRIVARGLRWCLNNDIDIVNLSFTIADDPEIRSAIDDLIKHGCTVVAAVGNRSLSTGFYAATDGYVYRASNLKGAGFPANMDTVIGVGAFNFWGKQAHYARDGGEISVDGRASFSHGTSISSARLVGFIAIILAEYPALSNHQIRATIQRISKKKRTINVLTKSIIRKAIDNNQIVTTPTSTETHIAFSK